MVGKLFLLFGLVAVVSATVKLQEVFSWNVLDWNYPDEYQKQQALQSGALIRENALPVGIERWRNKLFVSVPRWFPGKLIFFFFNSFIFYCIMNKSSPLWIHIASLIYYFFQLNFICHKINP